MRRSLAILVLVAALLVFSPMPPRAGGWHGRPHGPYVGHPGRYGGHRVWSGGPPRFYGGIVIGPAWWWRPPYPYRYYPRSNYVYVVPPAVVPGPSVYIQQQAGSPAHSAAWYYCPSSQAYYPTVQTCPEVWITVPPGPR